MKRAPWMILALGVMTFGACGPGVERPGEEPAADQEQEEGEGLSPQVEWLGPWIDEKLGLGEAQSDRVLTALRELELALAAGRGEEMPPRQYARISQDAWWTFEDSLRAGLTVSRQKELRKLGGGLLAMRLVMELELTPDQAEKVAALASELPATHRDTQGELKKVRHRELTEAWTAFNEALGPLLTPEQIARYQKIERLLMETQRERFEIERDSE